MPPYAVGPGDPDKIRDAIKRSGKTYRDIARSVGVSDTSIGNWAENIRKPAAGNLAKLARALGMDVRELLR